MARLATCGFDLQNTVADGITVITAGSYNTSTPRTGPAAYQLGLNADISWDLASPATTITRFYLRIATAGTYRYSCFYLYDGASDHGKIFVNADQTLQLAYGAATTVGSATAPLTAGTWYCIEVRQVIGAGATDELELRIDGASVASATGLSISDTPPTSVHTCVYFDSGVDFTTDPILLVEDVAINDSSGSDQNTWPGPGKVYTLRPAAAGTAGTSEANWTKPGGSTSSKWTSVDNAPPTFAADSTSAGAAESFLRNPTSATSDLTLACTDYTTAGITGSDTIKLVQAIGVLGNSNTTAKGGTIGMPANPTVSQLAQTFPTAAAASSTPSTWKRVAGTISYAPSVTLGTQPQVRVNRGTGTGTALINALAILVDAAPATTTNHALTGTIPTTNTVTAAVTASRGLTATIDTSTSTQAALTATRGLTGTIATTSSLTGSLTPTRGLTGAIQTTTSLTGSLSAQRALTGLIPTTTTVTGALRARYGLTGLIPTTTSLTGTLTIPAGAEPRLTRPTRLLALQHTTRSYTNPAATNPITNPARTHTLSTTEQKGAITDA